MFHTCSIIINLPELFYKGIGSCGVGWREGWDGVESGLIS